jgi:hypothetical protein
MSIGNCPRCGAENNDENEWCIDCTLASLSLSVTDSRPIDHEASRDPIENDGQDCEAWGHDYNDSDICRHCGHVYRTGIY